ncbi:ATP-binding protein [Myxococcota bacterium]|nr:ATP-binding protein [Myxococcota bacterium]
MDLAKYRALFAEEASEHLSEISRSLLELEKQPDSREAIDVILRLAHSIKGMAGTLDYDDVAGRAHAVEDQMQALRKANRAATAAEITGFFESLVGLERAMAAASGDEESRLAADPSARGSEFSMQRSVSGTERCPTAVALARTDESGQERPGLPELELPTPPPTVRVDTAVLDRFLTTVGEVILSANLLRSAAVDVPVSPSFAAGLDRMDHVIGELQRRALDLRTAHLLRIVEPLPRLARELAQQLGKRVEVEIQHGDVELDRSILDRLSEPLVHLIRNAVDHGIESPEERRQRGKDEVGRIAIEASREKDSIRLEVRDDGAGVDLEAVRRRAIEAGMLIPDLAEDLPPAEIAALVFRPGLSTADAISTISGRGVGMDAVRATIEGLGGSVELATDHGKGTTTILTVPMTAAVQRVLLADVWGETVGIPVGRVHSVVEVPGERIENAGGESFVIVDEVPVPVLRLGRATSGESATLVLVAVRDECVALHVERVVGHHQIYVKGVPELLAGVRALAGLTLQGDGRPVFLLDPNQLT